MPKTNTVETTNGYALFADNTYSADKTFVNRSRLLSIVWQSLTCMQVLIVVDAHYDRASLSVPVPSLL